MIHLAKSMMRFSWASTLLAADRLASVALPAARRAARRPGNGHRSAASLDAASRTIQGRLWEPLRAAFQVGDDLQTEGLDLFAAALAPMRWPAVAGELAGRTREALRFTEPGRAGRAARQELGNKYRVYWWVKGVRKLLELPPEGQPWSLLEAVGRAYELDAFPALWAIEGLGHDWTRTVLERSDEPRGILTDPRLELLPASSLPMLHAGLGLGAAEHLLAGLAPASPPAEVRGVLERFVTICRQGSRDGYADAALEALGLVARCFFADLVPVLERELKATGAETLRRFFWHGVGRAIYFVPVNFLPGHSSAWQAIQMARREAPDAEMRRHALAGVGYAFVLVNMADPRILEQLLCQHGRELSGTAFVDGLAAAVVMRQEVTPEAADLTTFLAYRPASGVAARWDEMVRRPCDAALSDRQDTPRTMPGVEAGAIYDSLARLPGS